MKGQNLQETKLFWCPHDDVVSNCRFVIEKKVECIVVVELSSPIPNKFEQLLGFYLLYVFHESWFLFSSILPFPHQTNKQKQTMMTPNSS